MRRASAYNYTVYICSVAVYHKNQKVYDIEIVMQLQNNSYPFMITKRGLHDKNVLGKTIQCAILS